MTQEQKELLLKDLCARLPYGVNVESVFINPNTKEHKSCGIEVFNVTSLLMIRDGLGEFKPYLYPLSSMTEEQRKEYDSIIYHSVELHYDRYYEVIDVDSFKELQDFYHINHLDYRGLIPMGLAIDCTNLNIY